MDDDLMKTHCIRIDSDGAAMHTGQASGLTPDSKNAFPNVQSVHCLAHRLELELKDSLQELTGCQLGKLSRNVKVCTIK